MPTGCPAGRGLTVLLLLPGDIIFSINFSPRKQTEEKSYLSTSFSYQVQFNNMSCLPAVCRESAWVYGRKEAQGQPATGDHQAGGPRYPGRRKPSAVTTYRARSQAVAHGAAGALEAGREETGLRLDRGVQARLGASRALSLGSSLSCGEKGAQGSLSQRTMSGSVVSNHMDGADCPVPVTQGGPSKWPLHREEPPGERKGGHEAGYRRPDQDMAKTGQGPGRPSQGCLGVEQVWTRSWQSVDQGVEAKDNTDFLLEYLGGWQG